MTAHLVELWIGRGHVRGKEMSLAALEVPQVRDDDSLHSGSFERERFVIKQENSKK